MSDTGRSADCERVAPRDRHRPLRDAATPPAEVAARSTPRAPSRVLRRHRTRHRGAGRRRLRRRPGPCSRFPSRPRRRWRWSTGRGSCRHTTWCSTAISTVRPPNTSTSACGRWPMAVAVGSARRSCDVVTRYQQAVLAVAADVLRTLATALDLAPTFFADRMRDPQCFLRMFHYESVCRRLTTGRRCSPTRTPTTA